MNSDTDSEILLRNYLLGDVSFDQILQVEERLAADPVYREALGASEDELIDYYLHQDLSDDELVNFKRHFLTTDERFESLRIARALKVFTERNPVAIKTPMPVASGWRSRWPAIWWQAPVAATMLVMLTGGGIALFRMRRSAPEMVAKQSSMPSTNSVPLDSNPRTESNTPDRPPGTTKSPTPSEKETVPSARKTAPRQTSERTPAELGMTILYPTVDTRSDNVSRNRVVPGSLKTMVFQLPILDDAPGGRFAATITDQLERVVLSDSKLRSLALANGVVVVNLSVPAQLLTPQKFEITVNRMGPSGPAEIVRRYSFFVPERPVK
jgi:hypothetical protein